MSGEDLITRVPVRLGERSYEILIGDGLIERAGEEISRVLPGARAAVVTDDNVAAAHLGRLMASLEASGISALPIVLPAGEKTKSFARLEEAADAHRALESRKTVGSTVLLP